MPRFVVLEHDHPFLHWDLLLEWGEAARTWRLLAEPVSFDEPVAAESLDDHRLHYLDYEGPVSGNRGEVTRWDTGTFEPGDSTSHAIEVDLDGERLRGRFRLEAGSGTSSWRLQRVGNSDT